MPPCATSIWGPSAALFGPLARQRAKFSTELNQVQTTLARTAADRRCGRGNPAGSPAISAIDRQQR